MFPNLGSFLSGLSVHTQSNSFYVNAYSFWLIMLTRFVTAELQTITKIYRYPSLLVGSYS